MAGEGDRLGAFCFRTVPSEDALARKVEGRAEVTVTTVPELPRFSRNPEMQFPLANGATGTLNPREARLTMHGPVEFHRRTQLRRDDVSPLPSFGVCEVLGKSTQRLMTQFLPFPSRSSLHTLSEVFLRRRGLCYTASGCRRLDIRRVDCR